MYEFNFYGLKDGGKLVDDDISRLIVEGISVNFIVFFEEMGEGEKLKGVGNFMEVVLLLWLNS